ncbi:MAG: HemK2/MTQ2 family protein methyltransferase, partial [Nanoarchaeota archaeon]
MGIGQHKTSQRKASRKIAKLPSDEVYEPREDSYLLKTFVEQYAAGHVLEIGVGSGLLTATAAGMSAVKSVLGVDINPKALKAAKDRVKGDKDAENKSDFKRSDLFSSVEGTFDTIICNPPYLPDEPSAPDLALDGGRHGYELIVRLLDHVNDHLTQPGIMLLLFSSLSKKEKIDEAIENKCLTSTLLGERKLDFETLYVYKIEKSTLLRELEMQGVSDVHKVARGKRGMIYKGYYKGLDIAIKAKHPASEAVEAINHEYKVLDFFRNEHLEFIPHVLFTGHHYFAYEFIKGQSIREFTERAKKKDIIDILKKILGYMRELDELGFTKEEMHRPHKHIFID